MTESQVIFIGGRSGVGKSTVAFAMHDLLSDRDIPHAVIEGDFLDLAYPAPWSHRLAEQNLAAMWSNYLALGYRRMIYTNTVSVLEVWSLVAAIGEVTSVTSVLLRASESAAATRLGHREHGESLQRHLDRSANAAVRLDGEAQPYVVRIDTDSQTPVAIAERILMMAGWISMASEQTLPDTTN